MKRCLAILLVWWAVPATAAEPDFDLLRKKLVKTFPEVAQAKLRSSPMPGLVELEIDTKVYYVSADGKHLFLGDLVDVQHRTNLTDISRQSLVKQALDDVGDKNMIVMAPKESRSTITVFTDVDCPYCARLHQDVPELNRNGIKVRYLLYPRAGEGSPTYRRSVAVWCAADRIKAVGIAKNGGALDMKTCSNPVAEHYRLGERLGISGTPTIFLENGRKIPGYVPAAQLITVVREQGGLVKAR